MRKYYDKIATFLCSIESDKLVHLLTCLLLTFFIGQAIRLFSSESLAACAAMGAIVVFIIGFFKEWYDQFTTSNFSPKDLFYDLIGCILGLLVTIV